MTTTETETWLEELKPGDTVFITGRGTYEPSKPATVTKITRTQIVIDYGNYDRRFAINGGHEIGGDTYHRSSLQQPTDSRHKAWEVHYLRKELMDKLHSFVPPKNIKWLRGFSAAIKPYLDSVEESR